MRFQKNDVYTHSYYCKGNIKIEFEYVSAEKTAIGQNLFLNILFRYINLMYCDSHNCRLKLPEELCYN